MPDPSSYTVGWICALKEELTAAGAFLDERHDRDALDPELQTDDNSYELGRIGKHNVVIAVLPHYGLEAAAAAARDMARSFPNLRFSLMVGIGGGAPTRDHDIRLGDVVVSARGHGHGGVVQYDFGKALQVGGRFQRTGALNQPPLALLMASRSLASRYELEGSNLEASLENVLTKFPRMRKKYAKPDPATDRLFRPDFLHLTESGDCSIACARDANNLMARDPRGEDEDDPAVHYGLIASANTVMKNAQLRDKFAAEEGVLCFEMEAAGIMNHLPCLVIRGICDYSDSHKQKTWQGYAAMTAAAYAKNLLLHIFPKQVESQRRVKESLVSLDESIASLRLSMDKTSSATKELHQDLDLAKLPTASGASFDSHAEENQSRCLPETRVELLQQIADWASSASSKPVFWLNGMAGTGKSTIARTFAQACADSGQLGASFFFKKGDSDRGNAAKFFTTIAANLLRVETSLKPAIRSTLRADPDISARSLGEQFEKLILQPLLALNDDSHSWSSRIIVIDALDECEKERSAGIILKLLIQAGALKRKPLRIFVTSRPDLHIRLGFKKMPDGTHQDLVLHQVARSVIDRDIRLFIEHELSIIREERDLEAPWPTEKQTAALVQLATPLFIVAATICRYIGTKGANPIKKIRKIILCGRSHLNQVDQLYSTLLDEILQLQDEADQAEWLDDFRAVVGAIALLMNPLSIQQLSRLLGRHVHDVRLQLDAFHSVLQIPDEGDMPVRLLHLSFREFLFDSTKKGQNPFWMQESNVHEQLAASCLRIMSNTLRRDICGLGEPAFQTGDVHHDIIAACVPEELQYACRYWVDHVELSLQRVVDYGDVHKFLQQHLLHWLEVMILIREYSSCVGLLTRLHAIVSLPQNPYYWASLTLKSSAQVEEFLYDARRFVLRFQFVADTPLQLYSSALMFAPEESLVRQTFAVESAEVSMISQGKSQWDPCLMTLEGPRAILSRRRAPSWKVTFAPKRQCIASTFADFSVRLWDTVTGVCFKTLHFSPLWTVDIVFLPDGNLLAMALHDGTICVWDMETETLHKPLAGLYGGTIWAIDFSGDQKLFAAACSEKAVYVWETVTWTPWATPEDTTPNDSFSQILMKFSPNETLIATSANKSKTVWLWEVPQGGTTTCLRTLEGHSDGITSIAFSPSIKTLLVSSSLDKTTRLWSTEGFCIHIINHDHHLCVSNIALSTNNVLAFASRTSLCLWDLTLGSRSQTVAHRAEFDGFLMSRNHVAFSPDGNLVALGCEDAMVRILEVQQAKEQGSEQGSLQTYSEANHHIVFSPDGTLVASCPHQDTVRLWNTATGKCLATFEAPGKRFYTRVAFSPDGQQLAVSSSVNGIKVWDLATFQCVSTFHGHDELVRDICYSSDGKILFSALTDGTVRLWDPITAVATQTLNVVVFSPDSTLMASRSKDGSIEIWGKEEAKRRATLQHKFKLDMDIDFSPNGKLLITTSITEAGQWDGEIKFWDTSTGSCCDTLSVGPVNREDELWVNFGFTLNGLSIRMNRKEIALPQHLRQAAFAGARLPFSLINLGKPMPQHGHLRIPESTTTRSTEDQPYIMIHESWLVCNGRKLLRIPHELFYAAMIAVWQNKVCWVTGQGQVFIMRVNCNSVHAA